MTTTTPPAAPACLITPYAAKPNQKGGTLIDESVTTLQQHRRLLCDPDAYRPRCCSRCGCLTLHVHDFRSRVLDDGGQVLLERIRRYCCVEDDCKAVWRILPAVIARHLHRTWDTVEAAVSHKTRVPGATRRRWLARLRLSATQLIQVLATAAQGAVLEITDGLSIACSRVELVRALVDGGVLSPQRRLQQLANWIHRIEPGVRLM